LCIWIHQFYGLFPSDVTIYYYISRTGLVPLLKTGYCINNYLNCDYSEISKFNVHGTMHCWMCLLYNRRDATYTMFCMIINTVCFGLFFRPSSGAYKTMCSYGYCHSFLLCTAGVDGLEFQPIHTSGRQQESMTIPMAAHTVL
jgi:hypothetical protein